ncbi:MAG TPA: acyltransferase [Caulobacteraceae bacterium]|nr:acyltransferase [Caulobacteraceae bacterium]
MKPLFSVQYLRAFAALAVVAFHACQWSRIPFDIGSAGVDVFFVISGFIMWRTTSGGEVRPLAFLKKRAIRIAPLYWTVTIGLIVCAMIWPDQIRDVEPTPWHVFASLAFIQHLNPQGVPFPILPVGWTLNYEAVFYLLFAGSLLVPKGRRAMVLTLLLAGVTFFGFLHPPSYIMLANPLLLEFAAGMWLARFMEEGMTPGRHAGWMLFVGGLSAFVLMQLMGVEWDLWRPLFWGLPAFMMVAGLVAVEQSGGLRELPWLRSLGDASYAIYLVHTLAMGAFAVHSGLWDTPVFAPLAFVIGVLSGWLVWKLFEAPVLRLLRGELRPFRKPIHTPV